MKREEAMSKIEKLRQLVDCFGGPYSAEHLEFKRILFSLRSGPVQDSYYREKLADLENQANTGFSVRKFQNRTGGLQQVKVWALGSLLVVESIVEQHWPEK
jgi:hypothetical protein